MNCNIIYNSPSNIVYVYAYLEVMFKSIKHPDDFCLVFLQEGMVAKLVEQPEKGADQDSRVIIAYIHQCTAEAQEGKPRK